MAQHDGPGAALGPSWEGLPYFDKIWRLPQLSWEARTLLLEMHQAGVLHEGDLSLAALRSLNSSGLGGAAMENIVSGLWDLARSDSIAHQEQRLQRPAGWKGDALLELLQQEAQAATVARLEAQLQDTQRQLQHAQRELGRQHSQQELGRQRHDAKGNRHAAAAAATRAGSRRIHEDGTLAAEAEAGEARGEELEWRAPLARGDIIPGRAAGSMGERKWAGSAAAAAAGGETEEHCTGASETRLTSATTGVISGSTLHPSTMLPCPLTAHSHATASSCPAAAAAPLSHGRGRRSLTCEASRCQGAPQQPAPAAQQHASQGVPPHEDQDRQENRKRKRGLEAEGVRVASAIDRHLRGQTGGLLAMHPLAWGAKMLRCGARRGVRTCQRLLQGAGVPGRLRPRPPPPRVQLPRAAHAQGWETLAEHLLGVGEREEEGGEEAEQLDGGDAEQLVLGDEQVPPPAPVGQRCQHLGCTKWTRKAVGGERQYCTGHMAEHGQQRAVQPCGHPGCVQHARAAMGGAHDYCIRHMKEHGQEYRYPPKPCEQPGCVKRARLALGRAFSNYCAEHMKQHGQRPRHRSRRCEHPGCGKGACMAVEGGRRFCAGHMEQRNLNPKCRRS